MCLGLYEFVCACVQDFMKFGGTEPGCLSCSKRLEVTLSPLCDLSKELAAQVLNLYECICPQQVSLELQHIESTSFV
jgi:hypothetical protein